MLSARVIRAIVLCVGLASLSYLDSSNYDEKLHLVAGIYDWQAGGHDLYFVNPPLTRDIAALPASFFIAFSPEEIEAARSSDFSNWGGMLGNQLWNKEGPQMERWLFVGRLLLIPLMVLGLLGTEWLSARYYGPDAAGIAGWLYVLTPAMLAAGKSISSDGTCAALLIVSLALFQFWQDAPRWPRALAAGWVLGIAMLTKTVVLFVPPLLLLVWLFFGNVSPSKENASGKSSLTSQRLQMLAILALAFLVVNAAYGFKGSFQSLKSYNFVCETLTNLPTSERAKSTFTGANRFRDSWLGYIPVPLPEFYVLGIDRQRVDFERDWLFFDGSQMRPGRWYDQLWAFSVKTPVGFLAILLGAFLWTIRQRWRGIPIPEPVYVWSVFLFLLLLNLSQTRMTVFYRYLVPCFPLLYVLASRLGMRQTALQSQENTESVPPTESPYWRYAAVNGLLILGALHVAFCFPYMTVYLNELVGGPWNGTKFYHTGSDMNVHKFRLTKWIENHKEETIYLTDGYFQDCKDLSPRIRPLPFHKSLPKTDNVPTLPQGWYVVMPQNIHLDLGSAIYLRDKQPIEYVAPDLAVYDMRNTLPQ